MRHLSLRLTEAFSSSSLLFKQFSNEVEPGDEDGLLPFQVKKGNCDRGHSRSPRPLSTSGLKNDEWDLKSNPCVCNDSEQQDYFATVFIKFQIILFDFKTIPKNSEQFIFLTPRIFGCQLLFQASDWLNLWIILGRFGGKPSFKAERWNGGQSRNNDALPECKANDPIL